MISNLKLKSVLVLIALILTTHGIDGSLINDFFEGAKGFWPKINDISTNTEFKKLPQVDFELPSENDEFIKQGLQAINAPNGALDICSHRVVMNLKQNCNTLTLEEIGKLAIMLMNCQLQVENRVKLPCKPEMTLEQCTMGMDQNMYQIYTIMTHRAVGICSALKHDQFRALTEISVNRLMQVTQSQTSAINEALQNQRRINQMGSENIREYEVHHEKIKEGQLKTLKDLTKATEVIEEIIHNEVEWKMKSEEQMLAIDKTASEVRFNLEQMIAHYQEALDFLDNFKSMMNLVGNFSNKIHGTFEKFRFVMREIGIEITAEFFVMLTIDVCYFIFGMIFIIFMGLSTAYKNILMALSIFNGLAAYYRADIPIAGTNIFVWILYIVFYRFIPVVTQKLSQFWALLSALFPKLINFIRLGKKVDEDSDDEENNNNKRHRSKTPTQNISNGLFKSSRKTMNSNLDADMEMEEIYANQKTPITPKVMPTRAETPVIPRAMSPALARVKSDLYAERAGAATPFLNQKGRIQCPATTVKGAQCKNAVQEGFDKCRIHNFSN